MGVQVASVLCKIAVDLLVCLAGKWGLIVLAIDDDDDDEAITIMPLTELHGSLGHWPRAS
jgi:hypothetical protein